MRKLDVTECPQQVQLYQDLDQIVSRISTETAPGKTAGRGEGSNLQSFISTVEAYGKLPEMSNGCDDDSRQSLLDDLRVCTAPFGEKDFSPRYVATQISNRTWTLMIGLVISFKVGRILRRMGDGELRPTSRISRIP